LAKKRISTLFFALDVMDDGPQKHKTPVEKLVDCGGGERLLSVEELIPVCPEG
jgi:hypothetical protein